MLKIKIFCRQFSSKVKNSQGYTTSFQIKRHRSKLTPEDVSLIQEKFAEEEVVKMKYMVDQAEKEFQIWNDSRLKKIKTTQFSSVAYNDNNFYAGLIKKYKLFHKEDQHSYVKQDKSLYPLAEIRNDIYVFMKSLRLFSLYIALPANVALILYNISAYAPEVMIFQIFATLAMSFLPYLFTENFVITMKLDQAANILYITKMNFWCKLVTRGHNVKYLTRLYRKNNIRPFAFFKNKSTNEVFSILKICQIKDENLLLKIIPERVATIRRKEEINKRLIDIKMDKTTSILLYAKIVLAFYLLFICLAFMYHYRKRNRPITVE